MTSQEQQVIDNLVKAFHQDYEILVRKTAPEYLKLFKELTSNDEAIEEYTRRAIAVFVSPSELKTAANQKLKLAQQLRHNRRMNENDPTRKAGN